MFASKIKAFLADESGATAIEYGLIAALVSVAAIVALGTLGDSLDTIFGGVAGVLSDAATNLPEVTTGDDTTPEPTPDS